MNVRSGFIDSIGNTPLIRLRAASAATGCEIFGKAEFLNPGGSVKDRAALAIIEDAEKRGALQPGGVIVEGTAGNTGIGLALVGQRAAATAPSSSCPRRRARRRRTCCACAAPSCAWCRPLPYANPGNYVRYSGRWPRSWPPRSRTARSGPTSSTMSPTATATTARPARRSGTRPTARSTASSARSAPAARWPASRMALKERNPEHQHRLADPMGSALYNWYTKGELKAEGNSITEGIGQGRITANLEGAPIDTAYQITDEEALPVLFDLVEHEGLVLGGSTGDQRRRRDAARQGARPGQDHRHHSGRRRTALSVQALQPGVPAREEAARPALDEMSRSDEPRRRLRQPQHGCRRAERAASRLGRDAARRHGVVAARRQGPQSGRRGGAARRADRHAGRGRRRRLRHHPAHVPGQRRRQQPRRQRGRGANHRRRRHPARQG